MNHLTYFGKISAWETIKSNDFYFYYLISLSIENLFSSESSWGDVIRTLWSCNGKQPL